jgi:hypothetical protein
VHNRRDQGGVCVPCDFGGIFFPAPTEAPAAATTEVPAAPVKTNPTTGGYLPLIGLGVLGLIIVLVIARFYRGKSHA